MGLDDRHSKALEVELISDPDQKAQQEAKNGLRQFDNAIEQIEYWLHPERKFKLRPSAILTLNRLALEGLSRYAGNFRPSDVEIRGSKHKPPPAHLVPGLVEELCDYVNEKWHRSPIHLASFVLWRLNWIHPFVDGNGRTTRALSFVVLCVRIGYRVPGTNTIPEQIAKNKNPYYEALELADSAYGRKPEVDVSAMEDLVGKLLANQLASVLQDSRSESPRPAI
ncbi:MAG TPA: Fic family protein [Candidatus Dormibacteraeota bacterium]|nr:Fic family protein [Candidatus Dormibacteraeota bacterium]